MRERIKLDQQTAAELIGDYSELLTAANQRIAELEKHFIVKYGLKMEQDRDALAAKVKELEKELEMHRTHITQSRCAVNGQKGGAK